MLQIFVSEITKYWYDTPWQGAGFFVLKAANLSEENEKLASTTCILILKKRSSCWIWKKKYKAISEDYRKKN